MAGGAAVTVRRRYVTLSDDWDEASLRRLSGGTDIACRFPLDQNTNWSVWKSA
jgi:hypothetical protein